MSRHQKHGKISRKLVSRLLLLSTRPADNFPAAKHHHSLATTKSYCLALEHVSVNNLTMTVDGLKLCLMSITLQ